jgi:hypothetical protein
MAKIASIRINPKCSDSFSATAHDETGKQVGEYHGYVPSFFPGNMGEDYVYLHIDIETGQITNWRKPSQKALKETFDL